MDLGIDSIKLVKLVGKIEKEMGIELYPTLFFEYQNISSVCRFLLENFSSPISYFFEKEGL